MCRRLGVPLLWYAQSPQCQLGVASPLGRHMMRSLGILNCATGSRSRWGETWDGGRWDMATLHTTLPMGEVEARLPRGGANRRAASGKKRTVIRLDAIPPRRSLFALIQHAGTTHAGRAGSLPRKPRL